MWTWDDVLKQYPTIIAITTDRAGRIAAHTKLPTYHEVSGRWVPAEGGERFDIGFRDIQPLDAPASMVHPPAYMEAREKAQAKKRKKKTDEKLSTSTISSQSSESHFIELMNLMYLITTELKDYAALPQVAKERVARYIDALQSLRERATNVP